MQDGHLGEALNYLEQAILLARQSGRTLLLVLNYMNVSGVHILQKRYDKALETALDGLKTCEQRAIKSTYHLAGLASNAGEACYYLGRYKDALAYADQAIQTEEPAHMPYALAVAGMTYHAQGKLDAADARLDQSLAWSVRIEDRYAEASTRRAVGALRAAQGRLADAAQAFEKSHAIFVQLGNVMEAEATGDRLAALQAD